MRMISLCTVLVLCSLSSARAQSAATAMQEFGLLGTWAGDCGQAPSPANNHATYAVNASGVLELTNTFGPDYEDGVYKITDAKVLPDGKLAMQQVLVKNETVKLDVVVMKENGRVRVWSSALPDGSKLVEDGTITSATGAETRWVMRCK
jgi:hypothetical protein